MGLVGSARRLAQKGRQPSILPHVVIDLGRDPQDQAACARPWEQPGLHAALTAGAHDLLVRFPCHRRAGGRRGQRKAGHGADHLLRAGPPRAHCHAEGRAERRSRQEREGPRENERLPARPVGVVCRQNIVAWLEAKRTDHRVDARCRIRHEGEVVRVGGDEAPKHLPRVGEKSWELPPEEVDRLALQLPPELRLELQDGRRASPERPVVQVVDGRFERPVAGEIAPRGPFVGAIHLSGRYTGKACVRRRVPSLAPPGGPAAAGSHASWRGEACPRRMHAVLQPGSRLGPYEIVSPLGSGGMGEVFRARDPRLGRDVAIKVLPDAIAGDPVRLHRFEEEARATSALSHSNIVTVYEIGREGEQRFLVMELVEGETLRVRLESGPLPPREAVRIAAQVAEGLAAAHGKGIVHRDLKPANIVVTRGGIAKILDFGLARRSVLTPSRPGDTHVVRKLVTEPGLVVGTAEYMSPEQVRGDTVDCRSDIFSFGTLLYEMLAGRMPFLKSAPAETMAAILMEEPLDLSSLVPNLPSALERIVCRCLEKNPERRFQSAQDLAFALEGLPWSTTSAPTSAARAVDRPAPALVGSPGSVGTVAGPAARRQFRPAVTAALLTVFAFAATLAFWAGRRSAPPAAPTFRRLTFSRGAIRSARFSPDGRTVVYGAAWNGEPIRLFTTQAESPESRRLELSDGDILAISSKGEMAISLGRRFLTLHLGVGTLARAPLAGQAPREVLERVQEADWAPDGDGLCVVRDVNGRNRLEFPVGKVLYETSGWLSHPRVSPAGDDVAMIDHPLRWDDQGAVIIVSKSGEKRVVSRTWQSAGGLAWGPGGREVWFTAAPAGAGRELHAAAMGGAERVVLRVSGNITLQDIHRNGRVLLSDDKWRRRLFFHGAGGAHETELTWLDWSYPRGVSADFSKLLFDEAGDGGGREYAVYLRPTEGGPAVHLGRGNGLALSPDGRWALTATVSTPAQLVLLPTGPGEPRQLAGGSIDHRVASFLPDGKRILFGGSEPPKGQRLFVQDLEGGSPKPVTPEGTTFADGVTVPVSPDGRSILVSGPDGSISIVPIEGGPARPLASLLGGDAAIGWGADSRTLFVVRPGELPAQVSRLDIDTGRRTPWREILPADPAGTAAVNPILIRPDGSAYIYGTPQILSDLYVVDGLR